MPSRPNRQPVRERLRAVRESTGLTQLVFAAKLDALAQARLGAEARRYVPATISKLETGAQAADFDDVELFALMDPERRGKLWLAWNERRDATLAETLEEVSKRTGIPVAGRHPPAFPTPAKKATRAGGQKRGRER